MFKPVDLILLTVVFLFLSCSDRSNYQVKLPEAWHGLEFDCLAQSWDEGIPLGNGMLGALIWQKEGKLRISLDRADLWDLRPVKEFDRPEFSYQWVCQQVLKGDYAPVQKLFDLPYDRDPAPTKIPPGALEFDTVSLGKILSVQLNLKKALCTIRWENGVAFEIFVHAVEPAGWYRWINAEKSIDMQITAPPYQSNQELTDANRNSLTGSDLRRLGYPAPQIKESENGITYHQKGWEDFSYDIAVRNTPQNEGVWAVAAKPSWNNEMRDAKSIINSEIEKGWSKSLEEHEQWWRKYWSQSSISVPDSILERQWYLEQYKFGAASGLGAPPISLQAVWTADHGRIPPWKGDFHHDLNTQLSYWPCYSSNHLEEGLAFLDWLWKIKPTAEAYTKEYYDSDGLNVPGVTTLDGSPMGGWIQYSLGPTVSAWLAHHG